MENKMFSPAFNIYKVGAYRVAPFYTWENLR